MSMFLPEGSKGQQPPGTANVTPADPNVTQEDVALMQRILNAAAANPNQIPDAFMAYALDYVQASNLVIPIGQVFGYQKIAPQVITDFAQVPAPVDGQIVLLKVGSGPYTYIQMMYDQNAAQWASEIFPAGGAISAATTATSFVAVGGAVGVPWSPVHTAGLTMQLKWAGTLTGSAGTCNAEVNLVWATAGGSTTSSFVMSQSAAGDGSAHPVGVDWTTVIDPGAYDMLTIGLVADNSIGGTTTISAGIVGRYIK